MPILVTPAVSVYSFTMKKSRNIVPLPEGVRVNSDDSMNGPFASGRRCLGCNAVEKVAASEAIWPLGWRCSGCGYAAAQGGGIPMFAPELADTVSGVDPAGLAALAKVETEHFWFVARNRLIVGLAAKFFPDARRFLEIGCGNGAVIGAMAKSRSWERLVGSELHPSALIHARQRVPSEVEFVQMDARRIPASSLFDLTGAFDVIEHIADDEGVLRGLRVATRPRGGIIVAVPQHPWLWSRADDLAHHERRYRRGELEAKLRRNGFEVLFSSSYTALLLPLMMASRLLDKGNEEAKDPLREFKLNPLVNRAFTAILLAEVRMTLAGLRWPAGGSRIVVGRAA
ncbi:class I SAM-dependent methyltransferase [Bradyrhizobium roseum]|uniref:class I SAM-dependent methyltransferase n=1 Tax=Bradyrhizobium roseum TaxID=3056648 RepID=UPI00261C2720|nr:class I SAM-dependent methyltransferase [Bradyrhizobium roseus]WKA27005.1 class I SAM-dependent methyltransferase [Bradyrhizobium roseus]